MQNQTDSILVTRPNNLPVPISSAAKASRDSELPLFVDCWQGQARDGSVLLIVHGLGEHGGRYKHIPAFLGKDFEKFYAMDQRGHGRSSGLRGYTPTFDVLVEDIKRVVAEVQNREKGRRLFLMAHSFGGLVALRMLLKERTVPFEAAIISAPLLGIALRVPPWKKFFGEVIGRVLSRVQLRNEVNPSCLSHDPKVVEAYVKDRLVHHKITPKLYLEMTRTMDWVNAQTGPLACPALFLIPGRDAVVDSKVTLQFFRNLKYRDKELREYPEMFHEVFNETDKEKVFADVGTWLKQVKSN